MSYLVDAPNFTKETINMLQNLSTEFIHYISGTMDIDIQTVFFKIVSIIQNDTFTFDNKSIESIIKSLTIIKLISNCPVGIWESDTIFQNRVESTLGNLLEKTMIENYHTVIKDCQSYDSSKAVCNHSNPLITGTKKHLFKCDFHLHDSVSMHLVLACIHNGLWAIHNRLDDSSLMKVMLLGLYHDIGKPLTVEAFEFKNSMVTGFPAHAEIGMMLFQCHHSPNMDPYISKEEYLKVGNAILRHMCGYHGNHDISNKYKRGLLMLEDKDVLNLLIVNRVGDHFGKLADPKTSNESPEHFIIEQKLFEEEMRKQSDFDLPLILKNNVNKNGSINPNKIILYLIGTSGAGKTYLLNRIINTYLNNVSYVSRDECIAEVCVNQRIRLENKDYVMMYSIYEAGKRLSSCSRKNNSGKKLSEKNVQSSESDILSAKKLLANSQKRWNDYINSELASEVAKKCTPIVVCDLTSSNIPDIVGKVQNLYQRRIRDALNDDKLFLVMDTFMNCFPMAIENNVPHEISKCFRVHIHVQSYLERKTTSVADSISDQLKISGSYGLNNPIHPDGFKYGKDKKLFASLSSEIGTIGSLPKSTFKSKFRPHLVYVCTRTENGDYGYEEMFSSMNILIVGYLKKSSHKPKKTINIMVDTNTDTDTDINSIVNDAFGVDLMTKNMNIIQFYTHLLEKHNGDRTKIRNFLCNLGGPNYGPCGFIHAPFIWKDYDLLNSIEQHEYCELLSNLSNEWKNNGIVSRSYSLNEFNDDALLREAYSQSIVTLKYFEQNGARFWQNVWAKEIRGTVLFINPETLKVDIMSFKLPRGAEAVTGMVKKKGLDTQDVISSKITILDDEQKDTCDRLCTGKDIRMHLTSKIDGSLCVINVYTGNAISIMLPIVNIYGTDYIRLWAEQSLRLSNGKRLVIPATQGSVIITHFMAAYMTTSLICGSNIVTRKQLEEFSNNYYVAWAKFGDDWMKNFLCLKFFDDLTHTHTFTFEAVCKNRCGLFNDHNHIELACSYDRDRLVFVGVSIVDSRFYISHTIYNQLSEIPFEQPLWWTISHASQVDSMIDDIDNMIMGRMSKIEYLTKYTPSNIDFDITSNECINNAIIDFEGWVAMKFSSFTISDSDHIKIINKYNIPLTIYSKIKTESYYRAHKFNINNVPYLAKLAKTSGNIFPLAVRVAGICGPGAIVNRLTHVGKQIMLLLDFNDPNNKLIVRLREIHANEMIKAQESIDNCEATKLPRDPLAGFEQRSFDIKCKIVLNYKGIDFGEYILPIYMSVFPELNMFDPAVKYIIVGLTMNLKPWYPGYSDRIKDLNTNHPSVKGLVDACISESVF
jgi:hypothetical protein